MSCRKIGVDPFRKFTRLINELVALAMLLVSMYCRRSNAEFIFYRSILILHYYLSFFNRFRFLVKYVNAVLNFTMLWYSTKKQYLAYYDNNNN